MISALTCIASHLRLQPSQAFLLIAPRLNDVIFILQRLLISESWQGPLYLLLLTGPALRREDLERHVALQPLLSGGVLEGSKNFLHDMVGFSVEEHMDSFASSEAVLEELVAKVHGHTAGVGVDVILALDVDLGPEDRQVDTADLDAACVALEPVAKRRALLRSMVSALALGGRLVTNRGLEISPAEGQHLWVKECSVSFFNPHCMPLSMLRHGELLHAAAEVCGRIAAGELCVTDSEVAQFYLFDQFQQALDVASREQGGRKFASGPELVTLLLLLPKRFCRNSVVAELARRLAEELAGPDAEARAQIYDEDLALARQLAEQEQADLEFAAPAKAVFAVDDSPPTKKRRAPSTDLDPVLSDTKEELSDMAKEEVENMWSRCLRGEELLDSLPANDNASSEAYAVHALHTLMSEFRRAPVAMIRSAFQQAGTYSEAKAIIEGSSEVTSLKSKRPPKAAPPCDVPPLLQKEVQLGGEAVSIHKALAKRKQVRQERVAQLKAVGGLGTCGCCFDDELLPEEELRCTAAKGHGFCIPCVKQAAMAFFGQGLFTLNLSSEAASSAEPNLAVASLRCLDTSNCPGHFLDTAMQKALPRKDYVRYSRRSAALQAAASGLKDLVSCPGCDFMVQMSDKNETFPLDTPPRPEDGVVRCLDVECGLTTCRWCMQPEHGPLKCEEVEMDSETKIRTFLEEKMAEAVLRRCPNQKCQKPYERTEGCNHIRCPCGTHSCYLCGTELDKKRPYDHYKDGHLGGGKNDSNSRCIVYGTPKWAEASGKKQREDAEKALQQYLKENPDLQEVAAASSTAKRKRLRELLEVTPERRNKKAKASAADAEPELPACVIQ
ncbi:unnamed protein product [Effrenium voratum]|nr:unnamed protein product [Effrenium voratum]